MIEQEIVSSAMQSLKEATTMLEFATKLIGEAIQDLKSVDTELETQPPEESRPVRTSRLHHRH